MPTWQLASLSGCCAIKPRQLVNLDVRNNAFFADMVMKKIIGKWKITEMEKGDSDFINAQGQGYFIFDANSQGSFVFGYVEGEIDFRESNAGNKPNIEYSWSGQDEMDESSGRGWFEFVNDDELYGIFYFHRGDESWVKAKRLK